jgi:hypothetical protein
MIRVPMETLRVHDPRQDDQAMSRRYALYLAPYPQTPLWDFGCSVLGYDAETGREVAQVTPEGMAPARFRELTREPRRYGFHATIKPPMSLAEGRDEAQLVAALRAFCAARETFMLPQLVLSRLGHDENRAAFFALVEPEPTAQLQALERDAVIGLDMFRAPLTAKERARRRPETLSAQKRALLERYGYPGVLEAFRFHMTLTGRVPADEAGMVANALTSRLAALPQPLAFEVDHLALFRQEGDAPFRIMARIPFGPAV